MDQTNSLETEIRETVISFLLFITSDECAGLLHRFMDPGKLAYELCRIWFDQIYAPGERYLEHLKGDFSSRRSEAFFEAFDVEEIDALERFHRFWELRVDMLPEKFRQRGEFPGNDTWNNIRRDAGYLLTTLAPDAEQRKQQFAEQVREIERKHQNRLSAGDTEPLFRILGGSH